MRKEYAERTNPYLSAARAYALQHSDDFIRPTGAVIVDDFGAILVLAANQSGLGRNTVSKTHPLWCLRKNTPSGTGYWRCPGCVSPSNHAEARAVRLIKEKDLFYRAKVCYLWGHYYACKSCVDHLESVGVETLVLSGDCVPKMIVGG